MLNITLTAGTEAELQQAAEDVVTLVTTDTTEPTPNDRDAWISDHELRSKLERPIGVNIDHWDWVLSVCDRALKVPSMANDRSSARALVVLMTLNAARRLPNPDAVYVTSLINEAQGLIDSLELSPRRTRLESLLDYHIGIWARVRGDYQLSINHQIRSAMLALQAGDKVGAAISQLCEQTEQLSLALVEGAAFNLTPLVACAENLVVLCRDSLEPIQRYWAHANAPLHVLLAHIWTRTPLLQERQEFWLGLVTELVEKHPESVGDILPTIAAVEAGIAMLNGQSTPAMDLAVKVVGSPKKDDQALMTTHWVLACVLSSTGNFTEATGHLQTIVAEGHNMHQLRALAKRELAK